MVARLWGQYLALPEGRRGQVMAFLFGYLMTQAEFLPAEELRLDGLRQAISSAFGDDARKVAV